VDVGHPFGNHVGVGLASVLPADRKMTAGFRSAVILVSIYLLPGPPVGQESQNMVTSETPS